MPNRILKETICTSASIAALSADAERFFYRLIVQADDFGRLDGRESVIRAKCFPLQLNTVSEKDITTWLYYLVDRDMVLQYCVEGKEYIQLTSWESHQHRRANHSKYPDPPAVARSCAQMHAVARRCPRGVVNEESRSRGVEESRNEDGVCVNASAGELEPVDEDSTRNTAVATIIPGLVKEFKAKRQHLGIPWIGDTAKIATTMRELLDAKYEDTAISKAIQDMMADSMQPFHVIQRVQGIYHARAAPGEQDPELAAKQRAMFGGKA